VDGQEEVGVEVTAAAWAGTVGLIIVLLGLDLAVGALRPHAVGFGEATAWSVCYVAVAVAFGLVLGWLAGWDFGTQYFAGYLVEKSLSVDNLFVFVVIMTTFAVPAEHQQKVLTFGIVLALIMRAAFIAVGAALLQLFSFMFLVFGLLLIWTAVQLYRHRDEDPEVEDNVLVRITRRVLPTTTEYQEGRLVTRVDGRRAVTPLFIVLVAIGSTDLLFALDSIPAVFGVTDEPYLVFTANAFALLGLRALFFLVQGLLDRLVYLSTGLAVVLAFIGVKLVLHWAHMLSDAVPEIPTLASLGVIMAILAVTIGASLVKARRDPGGAGPRRLAARPRPPSRAGITRPG
jgi:tellurite resistance protein TerC